MFEWKKILMFLILHFTPQIKGFCLRAGSGSSCVFVGTSQYKGPIGETSVHTQTAANGAINNLLMVFVKAIVQHETLNMLMIFWDWCKGRSGDLYHSGFFFSLFLHFSFLSLYFFSLHSLLLLSFLSSLIYILFSIFSMFLPSFSIHSTLWNTLLKGWP